MTKHEASEPSVPPVLTSPTRNDPAYVAIHRSADDRVAAIRRQVRDQVYNRLALLSASIWTLGTFLRFITLAARNERPIPMAMMSKPSTIG